MSILLLARHLRPRGDDAACHCSICCGPIRVDPAASGEGLAQCRVCKNVQHCRCLRKLGGAVVGAWECPICRAVCTEWDLTGALLDELSSAADRDYAPTSPESPRRRSQRLSDSSALARTRGLRSHGAVAPH
jgi:hypothetical protein